MIVNLMEVFEFPESLVSPFQVGFDVIVIIFGMDKLSHMFTEYTITSLFVS